MAALAPAGLAPESPHLAVQPVTIARVAEHATVPQNHIFLRPTLSVREVPMRAPLAETMVLAKLRVKRWFWVLAPAAPKRMGRKYPRPFPDHCCN